MTPRDASASSLSDHCSTNGGISLSRNASSSSLNATSSGDQAKSTNLTLPSGRRYRPRADGLHLLSRAVGAPRLGARVPRGRGAERVRAAMAEHDDAGITPEVWRKIVELGWTGLLVPESAGGLGLGLVDAVVVQEEMGRALFPGPFFSSAILATLAARALGLDRPARGARGRHAARNGRARRSRLRRPDRARARARGRARHPLQARRREADGARRSHPPTGCSCPRARAKACRRSSSSGPPTPKPVAEPRRHPQVRAHGVRRDARDARRSAGRPRRHLAPHRRRRGRAHRRRADRCERGREPDSRSTTRRRARCSASRSRSSR